jgi:16S rRNA (adenine(1408)-N(1))-methyltransferase
MQRIEGKKQGPISARELVELASGYDECLVDLGCGDGRFVLRHARDNPKCLCIGIDAAADAMQETSRRAAAKPAKGGASNAVYIVSGVEALPSDLRSIATRLTIQYPWGSLLRMLVEPDVQMMMRIGLLAVPGAKFSVLINRSPFDDPDYVARLDLPPLDEARFRDAVASDWLKAGFAPHKIETHRETAETPSSWGKRLVKGSAREVLAIEGAIQPA